MRGRVAAISATLVGVVVLLLVVVLATRDPATEKVRDSPLVGKAAPAIQGETVEGDAFDLDRYSGNWVLVNFFASWCVPCRQEHPELVKLSEGGQMDVVSVVFEDTPENVRRFFERNGGDWPVVEDDSGQATLSYGVAGLPESYLVAPDNTIVAKFISKVTASGVTEVMARFR